MQVQAKPCSMALLLKMLPFGFLALLVLAGMLQNGAALSVEIDSATIEEGPSLRGLQRQRVLAPTYSVGRKLTAADTPDESASSVSSVDTRTIIPNPSIYPFNAIGRLLVTSSEGELSLCTGTLVSANTVLTAGHCIIGDRSEPAAFGSGTFAPAFNPNSKTTAPFGTAKVTKVYVSSTYQDCVASEDCDDETVPDFALLKLDTSFTNTMAYGSAAGKGGQTINTAGYPGDNEACDNSDNFSGCLMYHDTGCKSDIVDPEAVYNSFPCLELRGQSGSPVWLYNKAANRRTIVGVVSFGNHHTDADGNTVVDGSPIESFTVVSDAVVNELAGVQF